MEVVAGVASVAGVVGILDVVGHAVQGIVKLKGFIHDVSTASETVKSFLDAIENLERSLTAICDLLKRAPEEWLVGAEARNTSVLASQLEKCRADIDVLVKEVPIHNANSLTAPRSFFQKLLVASHETAYSKFHQKVQRHQLGMQLSLSVLGRSYDAHIVKQGIVVAEQVKTATDQLDRMEILSQGTVASMSSLASGMSRTLEIISSIPAPTTSVEVDKGGAHMMKTGTRSAGSAMAKVKHNVQKLSQLPQRRHQLSPKWSCDFLTGIEAAFGEDGSVCLYCGDRFDQGTTEWPSKGRHLVDNHRYGECNLLLSYSSTETFTKHIEQFHQCCLGYDGAHSKVFISKHCRFGKKRGFHRDRASKDQNLVDDFYSIRSRRWEVERSGANLKSIPYSPGLPRQVRDGRELDLGYALMMEDWIVDGLMVTSSRPWSLSNDMPFYSVGDGIRFYGYEFDKGYLRGSDMGTNPGSGGREILGMSSAACARKSLNGVEGTNLKSRINSWLRDILLDSFTLKIILFRSVGHQSRKFSDLYVWLEEVLELWDLDEAGTIIDEADNLSDGAVDSRGSPGI